jgi:hypothetical protein
MRTTGCGQTWNRKSREKIKVLAKLYCRVVDPDPDWIRIRIGNPDPDLGARKLRNFSGKCTF